MPGIMKEPRAWSAVSLDDRLSWYYRLPEVCLEVIEASARELRRRPRPVTDFTLSPAQCAVSREALGPIREALERGRGFGILDGVPQTRNAIPELTLVYWLVGQTLGEPLPQNVQGTLLYDVRDTGQDVRSGARFSVTSADSTFHTDNSFGDEVVDYVGFLCVQPAKVGGVNQVVSAYTACQELRAARPEAFEVLARPFHIDRRSGVWPGQRPTAYAPVFTWHGPELLCRYLRYYIAAGHEKQGEPLTPDQTAALDALDDVLARRDLRAELVLRPGQMFFGNNRWLLHNRTQFEDHPERERRRHLVRLWLKQRPTWAARSG